MAWSSPARQLESSLPIQPLRGGIEFRNVSFRYTDEASWVLRHLNLTLHPGETVSLIGENGADKSTLALLLLLFVDLTEGEILYDEIDIRRFDYQEYPLHLGAVFQESTHFDDTIQHTIGVERNGTVRGVLTVCQPNILGLHSDSKQSMLESSWRHPPS